MTPIGITAPDCELPTPMCDWKGKGALQVAEPTGRNCDSAVATVWSKGNRAAPLKRVAKTLRSHRELILNWFRAQGDFSSGAVEGLNNKVKLVTRKSYGFRTTAVAKLALLHSLGDLPEPKRTHRFC